MTDDIVQLPRTHTHPSTSPIQVHAQAHYQYQYQHDLAALQTDATEIDLSEPFTSFSDDDDVNDNDFNTVKNEDPLLGGSIPRGVKREREKDEDDADLYNVGSSNEGIGKREHHNKHTRRCRARLKSKFDSLMATLPPPSHARGEVKHKVQILDYTMEVFEDLDDELRILEWNLALRSHKHLLKWIIAQEDPLQAFIDLFCNKFGFVYAEVWNKSISSGNNDNNIIKCTKKKDSRADNHVKRGWVVEKYSCHRTAWVDDETLSEIITTGQKLIQQQTVVHDGYSSDDHIDDNNDNDNSGDQVGERARVGGGDTSNPNTTMYHPVQTMPNHLLHSTNLRTCLLIPVFVMGDTYRIVALFDVRVNRIIDRKIIHLAATIAGNVGNIFAANQYANSNSNIPVKTQATPLPMSGPSPKQTKQQFPAAWGPARPKT